MEGITNMGSSREEREVKPGQERTYVTFSLTGEHYGLDVKHVNTISGLCEIRPVPNSMPFMKGVINIREAIIPVIDMRIKFGLDDTEYTKKTVIIIVSIRGKYIGLVVDSVLDVAALPVSKVQDTPHFSANIDADCIKGISKIKDKLVVIINPDKIVTIEELADIEEKGKDI